MMDVMVFPVKLTLGQKIRMHRLALRLRQEDLAYRAGVAQVIVSSLERDCRVYPAAKARVLEELGLLDDSPVEAEV